MSKYSHKHLFLNAAKLLTGTGGSQVITMVSLPFLTRLYTTSDFGVFGTFISVTTLAAIFLTLRYEIAIPIPKENAEARNIFDTARLAALINAMILTAVLGISVFFFSPPFPLPLVFLTPATAAVCALVVCSEAWLARNRRYANVAQSRIIGACVTIGIQFLCGLTGIFRDQGLTIGYAMGMLVTLLIETSACAKLTPTVARQAGWFLDVARKYSNFPKFLLVAQTMNSATSQLPVIYFQQHFGSELAGFYFAAPRALSVVDLIPTSVGQVFFNDFSAKRAHREPSHGLLIGTTRRLALMGLGIFSAIYIFSTPIFKTVLGTDWASASGIARILIPMYFIRFFTVPANLIYSCFDAQNIFLGRQIAVFAMVLLALLFGGQIGFEATIILYAVALSVCYIFDLGFCVVRSRKTDHAISGGHP